MDPDRLDTDELENNVFQALDFIPLNLNFLMIIALWKTPQFKKEYLTPTLVSISIGDFIFSIYVLPILSSSYVVRYDIASE